MRGFDDRFRSVPEYILGITYEIWEQRQVETLHRYYASDLPVRSPSGVSVGNEAVIAATLATQKEFPDRTLLGEDVIWSGDEDHGFLSSHRIFSTATHGADGLYGLASGTKLRYRVIADCAVLANVIYDEWLVRDQGAIVRQLGQDPRRFAANQIDAEGGAEQAAKPFTLERDVAGRYHGRGNDHPAGLRYEELASIFLTDEATASSSLRSIGDRQLPPGASTLDHFGAADKQAFSPKSAKSRAAETMYDRAVNVAHPGGVYGAGVPDAMAFWSALHAAFPTARFEVHHRIGRSDPGLGERAALRWSLTGTHDGTGMFGLPTGAPVHVMGISHAEFGPWGLRREFVLVDETAIWKQILLHSG